MEKWLNFKQELKKEVNSILIAKLESLQYDMSECRKALGSESKSSAGDKHETGRAMIQLEMEKLGQQLQTAEQQLKRLQSLPIHTCHKAEAGALISLSGNLYYLSLSLGQLNFEGQDVFLLSPSAPLAQAVLGREMSEKFTFRTKEMFLDFVI